jgi:protein ImuA
MTGRKADIISQLEKEILPLQGYKAFTPLHGAQVELGPIEKAFPNECFPLGAVHEFITEKKEGVAATSGFIAALLSFFMRKGGVCIWISTKRNLFPAALKAYDIEPDHILFIDLQKEKDILWAMEEALKCDGLTTVIAEIKEISFTESRRLQLAVEQSGVTGFILRHHPRNLNTIACVSRWRITSIASGSDDNMPGVGFPRWNVELLKIRNGKPGNWQVEWSAGRFHYVSSPLVISIPGGQKRKTG